VALLEHLFSLIPSYATVVALYDVGCVLARSLSKVNSSGLYLGSSTHHLQYDILPCSIISRLCFATTAMHAYGHEWACQLVYNPRMCVGLGLSDGEGTERLWSCLVCLIGIERLSLVCLLNSCHWFRSYCITSVSVPSVAHPPSGCGYRIQNANWLRWLDSTTLQAWC
jgi:hypothetical protein